MLVPLLALLSSAANQNYTAHVWTNDGSTNSLPELSRGTLTTRPNNGVCFVGGGTRSYAASIGYLRALHEMGALPHIRYFVGVSGGSWAISSFLYRQINGSTHEEYLGPSLPPEELSMKNLSRMTDRMMGWTVSNAWTFMEDSTVRLFFGPNSKADLLAYLAHPHTGADLLYARAVGKMFFEPINVTANDYFGWDMVEMIRIKQRNPSLANASFVFPFRSSPYPIISGAVLGPTDLGRLVPSSNFSTITGMEFTPLYSGVPRQRTVTYANANQYKNVSTGGFVETFALGASLLTALPPPHPATLTTAVFDHLVSPPVSLERATGVSSHAYAAVLVSDSPETQDFPTIPLSDCVARMKLISGDGSQSEMFLGDGGILENTGILSLLRRNVTNIMVLANTMSPLREDANLWTLFGINTTDPRMRNAAQDYSTSQVFASSDYERVVGALEERIAKGEPAIVTVNLTTIANHWWGTDGGLAVRLTWAYPSVPPAWRMRLPNDTRSELDNNASSASAFWNFPHYNTSAQFFLTAAQVNLLADLTYANAMGSSETIRCGLAIVSPTPTPTSSGGHPKGPKPATIAAVVIVAVIGAVVIAGVVRGWLRNRRARASGETLPHAREGLLVLRPGDAR